VDAPRRARHDDEETDMTKFLLLQNYEGGVGCEVPMSHWTPADITAHIEFQRTLNEELTASGELVDAQGLAGPDQAKRVVCVGSGAPAVADGPFPGPPLLAGYRMVDVESQARAVEIAARASSAPGPHGVAIGQPIEVRQIMGAPDGDL
jgi:hypothetical protein